MPKGHLAKAAEEMGAKPIPPEDEGWEESTSGDFFTFEKEGDTVEGRLVAIETVEFEGREVPRYVLDGDNGKVAFLGSTILDRLIGDIVLGTVLRVRYEGPLRSRKGRQVKDFRLWVKKG